MVSKIINRDGIKVVEIDGNSVNISKKAKSFTLMCIFSNVSSSYTWYGTFSGAVLSENVSGWMLDSEKFFKVQDLGNGYSKLIPQYKDGAGFISASKVKAYIVGGVTRNLRAYAAQVAA